MVSVLEDYEVVQAIKKGTSILEADYFFFTVIIV